MHTDEYLNELYGSAEDPWHMRSGWLAQRKRDLLLASLPNARYENAFEPGCSHGELTVDLARRTERLLAVDAYSDAVVAAHERTSHLSNVTIEYRLLPEQWPVGQSFDLIVLNEIGAMSSSHDWVALAESVRASVTHDATVVACHWRGDFPGRTLELETLHGVLNSMLALPRQTHVEDTDFTIAVWTTRPR